MVCYQDVANDFIEGTDPQAVEEGIIGRINFFETNPAYYGSDQNAQAENKNYGMTHVFVLRIQGRRRRAVGWTRKALLTN